MWYYAFYFCLPGAAEWSGPFASHRACERAVVAMRTVPGITIVVPCVEVEWN